MRVLYFTRDYTPHDHRFLSALAKTDHDIYSLRLERAGVQREERPLPAKVNQIPWQGGSQPVHWKDYPSLAFSLKGILREVQPHLVHAGSIQTAAFLTSMTGFHPLVSMSWGSDLLKDALRSPWMRCVTRFTLEASDVLVADCQTVGDTAIDLGFPMDRIVVFPWGVDLDHFSPEISDGVSVHEQKKGHFTLLSLRAWEPIYGVDVVIRAFCKAASHLPQLHLMLLGGGSQAAMIHNLLERHGMEERVTFGGIVRNASLPKYYRSANLYLSASHSDGSSVSLMEALACGIPVLVSDIKSNREWIEAGVQGWLFPDGDADALAEMIVMAVEKNADLDKMGQNARKLAQERADWNINFSRLLDAYDMAIKNGTDSSRKIIESIKNRMD